MPWDASMVCDMVEVAFRRRGAPALPSDVSAALKFDTRFGLDPDDWRMLLARSWAVAGGTSIEEARRQKGWSGSTFQRGWRRAAETIAEGMNVERGRNRAAFQANEEAENRLLSAGRIRPAAGGVQPSLVVRDGTDEEPD